MATPKIKLTIQQPALAEYRIALFERLAQVFDLHVVYGTVSGLPNATATTFSAAAASQWQIARLGRRRLYWNWSQLKSVATRASGVVVLSWDFNVVSLSVALLVARVTGVPTVLWGHGYSKRESFARRFIRLSFAQLASAILLYDDRTARRLSSRHFEASRVFVARNSVDQHRAELAAASWSSERLAAFRVEQGLGGPVLLFVSRLDPANQVDMLIRAVALLRHEYPDVIAVIIGGGDDRARLERLSEELDCLRQVRFVGPQYDEGLLAPWFLNADVLCYPANAGLSVLHAMSYGLPVVTCDDFAAQGPEVNAIEDGVNGMFYRSGSAEDLARAIEAIVADPAVTASMKANARETIRTRYNIEAMTDGFAAAVRRAAECRR